MAPLTFDFDNLAPQVEAALRHEFPQDTIDTREGYLGRVQVLVVSKRFNGLSESEKQSLIWDVLRARLGPDSQAVSVALAYGTDEL